MSDQAIEVRCVEARNVLCFHLPRPLTTRRDGETLEVLPLRNKATVWMVHPVWGALTNEGRRIIPSIMGIVGVQQLRSNDSMSFSLVLPQAFNDAMAVRMWRSALPRTVEILRSVQGRQLSVVARPPFDGRVDHWHEPLVTELYGMPSTR